MAAAPLMLAFNNKTVLFIRATLFSHYECRLGIMVNAAHCPSSSSLSWIPIENAAFLIDIIWAAHAMEGSRIAATPLSFDLPTVIEFVSKKKECYLPLIKSPHCDVHFTRHFFPDLPSVLLDKDDDAGIHTMTTALVTMEGNIGSEIEPCTARFYVRVCVEGRFYMIPTTKSDPSVLMAAEDEAAFAIRLKKVSLEKQENDRFFVVKGVGCGGPFHLPSSASLLFDSERQLRMQAWSSPDLLATESGDNALATAWRNLVAADDDKKDFYGTCFLSMMRFFAGLGRLHETDEEEGGEGKKMSQWEEVIRYFTKLCPMAADTHGGFQAIVDE